jgi:hypothetical protein
LIVVGVCGSMFFGVSVCFCGSSFFGISGDSLSVAVVSLFSGLSSGITKVSVLVSTGVSSFNCDVLT